MLFLFDVTWDQVAETLAKRVDLRVLVGALLTDLLAFWLHLVRLAAVGRHVLPIVPMCVTVAWARVVLVNLSIGSAFTVNIQWF